MSILAIGLLILAFVCFGYLAHEAHKNDMAALDARWQAKYDTDHGDWADEVESLGYANLALRRELTDEKRDRRSARAEAEWLRVEKTFLQAELDCHFLMPTIDGTRAAHRAKVTPIRGVGR